MRRLVLVLPLVVLLVAGCATKRCNCVIDPSAQLAPPPLAQSAHPQFRPA